MEDEAIIAMREARIIEGFGYAVETAYRADRAVVVGCREDVDLILMDIDLGDDTVDGTEVARRILANRHVPIVFLTSHSEREMVDRVRGITRYGYVLKTAGEFVLRQSIDMAFELFETMRKLERARQRADATRIERFEDALGAAGLAWWEMTLPDGRVTFDTNKTRMLGFEASDFSHYQDFMDLVHPDDVEPALEAMRAHLAGIAAAYETEYRIRDADGRYHWFRDVGTAQREPTETDQIRILGIVMDVSSWRAQLSDDDHP